MKRGSLKKSENLSRASSRLSFATSKKKNVKSSPVAAFREPPFFYINEANSAISGNFFEPMNNMCSQKWAIPLTSGGSFRLPLLTYRVAADFVDWLSLTRRTFILFWRRMNLNSLWSCSLFRIESSTWPTPHFYPKTGGKLPFLQPVSCCRTALNCTAEHLLPDYIRLRSCLTEMKLTSVPMRVLVTLFPCRDSADLASVAKTASFLSMSK